MSNNNDHKDKTNALEIDFSLMLDDEKSEPKNEASKGEKSEAYSDSSAIDLTPENVKEEQPQSRPQDAFSLPELELSQNSIAMPPPLPKGATVIQKKPDSFDVLPDMSSGNVPSKGDKDFFDAETKTVSEADLALLTIKNAKLHSTTLSKNQTNETNLASAEEATGITPQASTGPSIHMDTQLNGGGKVDIPLSAPQTKIKKTPDKSKEAGKNLEINVVENRNNANKKVFQSQRTGDDSGGKKKKIFFYAGVFIVAAIGITVSIFSPSFFTDIGAQSDQTTLDTLQNAVIPNANLVSNKKEKNKGQKSASSAGNQAVIEARVYTSAKTYEKSKNKSYFNEVDYAIISGNPIVAITTFKKPLAAALSNEDKIVATELEGRYYLLNGLSKNAALILQPQCLAPTTSVPSVCLHYLRALVSLQKKAEIINYIKLVKNNPKWSEYRSTLEIIELSVAAITAPNIENVNKLINNYISELTINAEWYRQRNIWIVKAISYMSKGDRFDFVKNLLTNKKNEVVTAIKNAETAALSTGEPLFVPYLNYLASTFELNALPVVGSPIRFENDASRLAILFNAIAHSPFVASDTINSEITGFIGKKYFGEIGKIISANLAIANGEIPVALNFLTLEFANIQANVVKFPYEWSLIYARCASQNKNVNAIKTSLREMQYYAKNQELVRKDLFHELTVMKLNRMSQVYDFGMIAKAKQLALTQYEKGLVYAEEAQTLRAKGMNLESVKLIVKAVKEIPNHGILYQTASEIVPVAGINPGEFLEAYSRIPEKLALRNREISILSDASIIQLINQL